MADDRLMRALAAARPPVRDNAFVVAVMARAERDRFRRATLQGVFRAAMLAAAVASLVLPVSAWPAANPDLFETLLLGLGAAGAMVVTIRALRPRAARQR